MSDLTITSSAIDTAIANANHSPDLSDQVMLVELLEKLQAWVDKRKEATGSLEHTQASGGIRTALRAERSLLHDMMRRNHQCGQALQGIRCIPPAGEVHNALC